MKHLHILGICGTFMGGIAAIAREAGYRVTGADRGIYPPMSEQLARLGIGLVEGYEAGQLDPAPDMVIVGNVMSRGMPVIEEMLNRRIPYLSGPEWLARHVLHDRWVMAVAGTHGKTTTSSLLAWIMHSAGHDVGYLIGGVPADFPFSARLGTAPFFVIEADEYDTAFFDKRPKFLLYRPRTLVIGNLEYDHADIYPDLDAIIRQFHQLVRGVPGNGRLILPAHDAAIGQLLEMGCWTPCDRFSATAAEPEVWVADAGTPGSLQLRQGATPVGECSWRLSGAHNAENALAALLAARHAGVTPATALAAIGSFSGVRRRLEHLGHFGGVDVYDDFAHHPTAIRRTLEGLRPAGASRRLLAVVEPRSNSMRLGVHRAALPGALAAADLAWLLRPADLPWDLRGSFADSPAVSVCESTAEIIGGVLAQVRAGDIVIIMSNGGFGDLREALPRALRDRAG